MAEYDDDVVSVGDTGVTIKHYLWPGRPRLIGYDDIVGVEAISLKFGTGRYRLVGFSPGRPRHYFHWDRNRSAKSRGLSVDVGRWRRLAITPDDPDRVLDLVRRRIERD